MTKKEHAGRVAYPALPNPLHSSDIVRLFTPTAAKVAWACG